MQDLDPAPATPATTSPDAATPAAPARRCENCGTPLLGEHCYACGQPTKGLVRHFSSVVGDFMDTVFNIDSRVLRTLGPLLFRPGWLTQEYFAGRRVRYVTPARLFLFLSLLAFFAIHARINVGDEGNVKIGPQKPVVSVRSGTIDTARTVAEVEAARAKGQPAPAEPTVDGARGGSINFPVKGKNWDPVSNPVEFAWLPEAGNRLLNRRLAHAREALDRDGGERTLVEALFNVLPQTLIVMMPLFALMLKVAYFFRRRLYMEHLIVALHSHAFIALALSLVMVLSWLQEVLGASPGFLQNLFGWGIGLTSAWIPVYLLLMQKRVYGQGWLMTLLKFGVLGFLYSILLGLAMAAAMLIGLLTL